MSGNTVLKGMVIFAAGVGVGVLATARHFYAKATKACNEYEEKCAKEYEDLRKELEVKGGYESESLKNSREEKSGKPSASPSTKKIDYANISKQPDTVSDVIKRAEEKMAEEESPMENDTRTVRLRGPRLIPETEYGTNRTLEHLELFYYTDNDILTNEDDIVLDPDAEAALIGDALYKFDFATNDEKEIYVSNEKHGCDYIIHKIKGAFTE